MFEIVGDKLSLMSVFCSVLGCNCWAGFEKQDRQ